MNPAMMNPDMMKAAQDMMSKMSPEEMNKMMEMQKQMCARPFFAAAHALTALCLASHDRMANPAMMQQAQQMLFLQEEAGYRVLM